MPEQVRRYRVSSNGSQDAHPSPQSQFFDNLYPSSSRMWNGIGNSRPARPVPSMSAMGPVVIVWLNDRPCAVFPCKTRDDPGFQSLGDCAAQIWQHPLRQLTTRRHYRESRAGGLRFRPKERGFRIGVGCQFHLANSSTHSASASANRARRSAFEGLGYPRVLQ